MFLINTVKDFFISGKIPKEAARLAFDWKAAAKLISKYRPYVAYAGFLKSKASFLIYKGGIAMYPQELLLTDTDVPVLKMDNHSEPIPCYVKEYEDYAITWTKDSLDLLTVKIKSNDRRETHGIGEK